MIQTPETSEINNPLAGGGTKLPAATFPTAAIHIRRGLSQMRQNDLLSFCLGIAAGVMLKMVCDQLAVRPHNRPRRDMTYIRPAGKRQMQAPPRDWDIVDEQSDESFPASDPPGNY